MRGIDTIDPVGSATNGGKRGEWNYSGSHIPALGCQSHQRPPGRSEVGVSEGCIRVTEVKEGEQR